MRYLKYIYGFQLLIGSIWCFYYSIYWAGFLLLILALILLIPLIYKLLKNKLGGFKSGCLIFSVLSVGISWFCISYLCLLLAPVDNTINPKKEDNISFYVIEQNLIEKTRPCFDAYDKAFSKTIKYKEDQCKLIYDAQQACNSARKDIENINIPKTNNTEIIDLLIDAKSDATNSLQGWKSFFGAYSSQCTSGSTSMNPTEIKLQLISAIKNMYLMNMKIKKAKSMS